jgi:RNA ligase
MLTIHKYPRTPHIQGSRLGPGDEDLDQVPFAELVGRHLVVEEKLDGANAGVRFDERGQLWLQCRGHYLTGGPRERQFNLFKQWASALAPQLYSSLGSRYVLYGEWLFAKHTVFYDQLPHYFHEFDILDTQTGDFLSTEFRRILLHGLPVVSVPVLFEGITPTQDELLAMVQPSLYKSPMWRDSLWQQAEGERLDAEQVLRETDASDFSEGLYLKVEEDGRVIGRYKYVRADFLSAILDSGTHWMRRPIVPNRLADGVDLFGGVL